MSSIIPDWTRAHRAGQIAFGSSRCPSTCSNTAASHGGSAWSRHPQTLPWATQQERNIIHIRTVIIKSCCIYMNDVVKTYRGEKRLSFSYNKWTVHGESLNLFSQTTAEPGRLTVLTKPNLPRRITLPLWHGHLWHRQPQVGKAPRDFTTNTEQL